MLRNAQSFFLEGIILLGNCVPWGTQRSERGYFANRTARYGGERRYGGSLANQYRPMGDAFLFGNRDIKLASDRLLGNGALEQPICGQGQAD